MEHTPPKPLFTVHAAKGLRVIDACCSSVRPPTCYRGWTYYSTACIIYSLFHILFWLINSFYGFTSLFQRCGFYFQNSTAFCMYVDVQAIYHMCEHPTSMFIFIYLLFVFLLLVAAVKQQYFLLGEVSHPSSVNLTTAVCFHVKKLNFTWSPVC